MAHDNFRHTQKIQIIGLKIFVLVSKSGVPILAQKLSTGHKNPFPQYRKTANV